MLIAVTVNKENKLSLNKEDTEQILIFSRKFDRVKLVDSRQQKHMNFADSIKDCKYLVSRHINSDSETSNALTDLGVKIIHELRTRDPYYAIRLM